jgi:DNA invertase Pin-like site-specific DNA recombinase
MGKHKPRPQSNSSFGENTSFDGCEGLIYVRVSSKRQELEGNGLQSQKKRCVEKLMSNNIPYREEPFSDSFTGGGDFMRRPAIRELLAYIDNNPHKKFVVVFDDLKRFARDVENHIKLKYAMKSRGVILLCANYTFEETPEGEAMELVSAIFNELERKQNKRQVVQKMKARLENGYRAFPCVKGYTRVKDTRHGKIDVLNKDAPFVKEALEGFASMRFVYKIDAVRFLQEKGVISKRQSPDKAIATFDKMLQEVFYPGYIEYLPWEVARREGHHEALITLDVYEKNQRRLNQSVVSFIRQDVRDDFMVRGLVNCADCGKKYTGGPSGGEVGLSLHEPPSELLSSLSLSEQVSSSVSQIKSDL